MEELYNKKGLLILDTKDYIEVKKIIDALNRKGLTTIDSVIFRLNQFGNLDQFLNLLNYNFEGIEIPNDRVKKRKQLIYVIGDLSVKMNVLYGMIRAMGLDKDMFKFVNMYEANHFNVNKLKWNDNVKAIFVGPMPHKTCNMGDYASLLSCIQQNKDKFPMTIELRANKGLKITKEGFRNALIEVFGCRSCDPVVA